MIQLLILFILMVFLSAVFINGFYNITRGQWNTNPDGSKEWNGKVFSFWSKFLTGHIIKREYYIDREWLKILDQISYLFDKDDTVEITHNGIIIKKMAPIEKKLFEASLVKKELTYTSKGFGTDGEMLQFYKEVKVYKIPTWVSAPLGECITCLSSVAGTICWIFWYQILIQIQSIYPTAAGTILTGLPFVAKIGMWIFFCFSLAWANEIIFFTNNKLKQ